MCGRYYIPPEDDDSGFLALLEHVNNTFRNSPLLFEMKRGEIFPTNIVPIVTQGSATLMKWGFSRFDGKGQIINARLETAEEKPTFKKAYEAHCCLVPAGYYFEWQTDGAKKQKYAIGTGAPIMMAGLYKIEPDSSLPLFVILTRPAAPSVSFIHDRMPVIMPNNVGIQWLASPIAARTLLEKSEELMQYRNVV